MNKRTMIAIAGGFLMLAGTANAAITLTVSSRTWKSALQTRYNETGLQPSSPINYEITGMDAHGALAPYDFTIPSDKFGKDGNTITVQGTAPFQGMRFCDLTNNVCANY